jgi:hypothetical protein
VAADTGPPFWFLAVQRQPSGPVRLNSVVRLLGVIISSRSPSSSQLSYRDRWVDGLWLYLSFVIAGLALSVPGGLLTGLARAVGGDALGVVVGLAFALAAGPLMLSWTFRAIEGSSPLAQRLEGGPQGLRGYRGQSEAEGAVSGIPSGICPACGAAITQEHIRCPSCKFALR